MHVPCCFAYTSNTNERKVEKTCGRTVLCGALRIETILRSRQDIDVGFGSNNSI
jgi:hypothetical protein